MKPRKILHVGICCALAFLVCTAPWAAEPPLRATDAGPAPREASGAGETLVAPAERAEAVQPAGIRVLLCHADYGPGPLVGLLLSYPDVAAVDEFDARSATPSLALLQGYDVVVCWSNYLFADPAGVGNVLADYLDAGGRVILSQFAYGLGWDIQGRIVTGGYSPFVPGDILYFCQWLGTFDAGHAIMQGIAPGSLGDIFGSAVGLDADATLVASWQGGVPHVATRGCVVGINSYPGPDYTLCDSPLDNMGLLYHNAVLWLVEGCNSCPAIAIEPPSPLQAGDAGAAYSVAISAGGGTAPYTYAVTAGALPPGLALSPVGTLSGSPTADGMATFTVTATDAEGCSGSQDYNLCICPEIYFDPNPWTLPNALLGQPYSFQLGGAGGTAPYTISVIQNSLPPGLSINEYCGPIKSFQGPEGTICGIPTTAGNYGFTLQLTDAMGCSTTRWFEIYVCPVIAVGPATIPSGRVGTAYSRTFTAAGGTAPYTFSLAGTLPAGLNLVPATGVLSGTPTAAGIYYFTVTATDNWGCQESADYTLVICGTITLAPNSPLPGGQVGVGYSQIITATGAGAGTYTFAVSAGTLPPAITLDAGGLLSGTPLYGGTYSFTVRATFEGVCTGTKACTIYICPIVTVNPATLPAGKKGMLYSKTLTGAGGTAPYTFSLAGGALPSGLALTAAGKISGYPTAAGTYNFTIRARDSKGCTGTRTYTVVINP